MAEDTLGFTHTIGCGGVPEVQSGAHSGVEYGFQFYFIGVASKYGVSSEHSCAPGPGSKCDFSLFHNCVFVLSQR